jgi:hypothetical protein
MPSGGKIVTSVDGVARRAPGRPSSHSCERSGNSFSRPARSPSARPRRRPRSPGTPIGDISLRRARPCGSSPSRAKARGGPPDPGPRALHQDCRRSPRSAGHRPPRNLLRARVLRIVRSRPRARERHRPGADRARPEDRGGHRCGAQLSRAPPRLLSGRRAAGDPAGPRGVRHLLRHGRPGRRRHADTSAGRRILGVVDGAHPRGCSRPTWGESVQPSS